MLLISSFNRFKFQARYQLTFPPPFSKYKSVSTGKAEMYARLWFDLMKADTHSPMFKSVQSANKDGLWWSCQTREKNKHRRELAQLFDTSSCRSMDVLRENAEELWRKDPFSLATLSPPVNQGLVNEIPCWCYLGLSRLSRTGKEERLLGGLHFLISFCHYWECKS